MQIKSGGLDSSEIFTSKKKRKEIMFIPNFAKKVEERG